VGLITGCVKPRLKWTGFELTTLVVTGSDRTGSCKSNYHKITTAPIIYRRDQKDLIFVKFWQYSLNFIFISHFCINKWESHQLSSYVLLLQSLAVWSENEENLTHGFLKLFQPHTIISVTKTTINLTETKEKNFSCIK
jgi:hypothetical protein